MPEPFKNFFNEKIIIGMGRHFAKAWPEFDQAGFVVAATHNLDALELKQRSAQISDAMRAFLPNDFEKSAEILVSGLAPDDDCDIGGATVGPLGIAGWAILPMTHYVGLYGQGHFDVSMGLLREMTKRFSSEFGIRFFLLEQPQRTLAVLEKWTRDRSRHVRRLVSEGTRSRLPWAMSLPAFIDDPAPVLPLLEALRDDKEEYVRRSVANNLNDIAKDHPDIVAKVAAAWWRNAGKERQKLVRHACRTLIKQGHKGTLAALGYGPPSIELVHLTIQTPQVVFGDALQFEMSIASTSKKPQALIVDYAIHHRKANGGTSPKVFKWQTILLEPLATHSAKRKHAIRKITTRVYYPGTHHLEILINGVSYVSREFELLM